MIELGEQLVSESEAAAALHVKKQTLTAWRNRGQGPAFVRVGKLIFYKPSHLREYIDSRIVRPGGAVR
jgi:hypothetical protein